MAGARERARRSTTYRRSDGSVIEVEVHLPADAQSAVMFENGLGMAHECWDWVSSSLPGGVAYVRYNRPGYGVSRSASPPTLDEHISLLSELRSEYVSSLPVTLVGHSLGGYLAAAYAASCGADDSIERVVLVDATNIDSLHAARDLDFYPWVRQSLIMEAVWSAIGLAALAPVRDAPGFRPEIEKSLQDFSVQPGTWLTSFREFCAAAKYPSLQPLNLPLDVVSAHNNLRAADHDADQLGLLKLSDRSRHHIIGDAEHLSVLSIPAHARHVSQIIMGDRQAVLDASEIGER